MPCHALFYDPDVGANKQLGGLQSAKWRYAHRLSGLRRVPVLYLLGCFLDDLDVGKGELNSITLFGTNPAWIQIRSIEASFMPVSLYPIFCSRISTSMTFGFRQFLRTCSAELRSAVTIELHQLILRNYSSQCLICLRIRTYIVNMYNDVARPLPDALSCALSPFLTALRPAVWDTPADGMADTAMTLSCKSARNGDTDYGFSNISTWADRNHG